MPGGLIEIRCWRSCLVAVAGLLMASGAARSATFSATLNAPQSAAMNAPLSERVVAYQIEGRYEPKTHTLDAHEVLTYTNRTGIALTRFPFHLYLNAFQPKSSWMTEAERGGMRDVEEGEGWDEKKRGSNEVKSLEIVEAGTGTLDVTRQMKFISPDDGNPDDRTVFEIVPPRPLEPGAQIQFRIHFVATFPEVVERTGYKRDFLMAGQWFPKVGVWWNGAWNCHQFHAFTEFFADFGTFDVKLTLPSHWNVGSSGVQTGQRENGDGTQTVSLHGEDIHDFAWTASPETRVVEDSIVLSRGPVKIRMLMQPGHMASAGRYMQALKGTMRKFDEWIGPYPYAQITVVDPPHGGGAAGGMEYPTLITADTTWWMPRSYLEPEVVVEHEFGHQYWYGMVATNEFENAWMDEGINQYMEAKVMDALYGKTTSTLNSRLGTMGERGMDRLGYVPMADRDPLSRMGWKFEDGGSYGGISYSKTALMMLTLESLVGEPEVMHGLRQYFERYRFQHPTPEQFKASMNESLGQNMDWYWKQAIDGTEALDDRILSATSERVDWYSKEPEKKGTTVYYNEVVVHRRGSFALPVTLEAKFDDGTAVREHWDGNDRWHRFQWERKAKLVSAEVDPDHGYWLDRDPFNNSWTAKAHGHARRKLVAYWTVLAQWLAQLLSWLA
jgi:hypothetical protein